MNAKCVCLVTVAASTIYQASPASPTMFTPHALPVLVRVDRNGKITYVAPAYPLRTQYRRLLVKTIDQMITKPAHNGHGVPVASQLVMYMTAKTTKRKDGSYNFQFTYVAANPVPFGSWYWGHYMGDNLALIEDPSRRPRSRCPMYYDEICFIPSCIATAHSCNGSGQPANDRDKKDSTKPATTAQHGHAKEQVASVHVYRLYRVTSRSAGALRHDAPSVWMEQAYNSNTTAIQAPATPAAMPARISRPMVSTPASRGVMTPGIE